MRAVICKDDPTSHGGKVLEGNEHATTGGRPIAQQGHMTHCPKCKGDFAIVEGLGFHTYAGLGTAVEGMKTACGAELIATTTKESMLVDDQPEGAGAPGMAGVAAAAATHHGSFRAVDAQGQPVAGMPYRIELPDGSVVRGATGADGYTQRVSAGGAVTVRLHWENGESEVHSDTPDDDQEARNVC